ncbi:DEAD/DEAH box helicase [Promicromonospora sp. NPDC052451]|uniref:DEAD/DEAH box helicase n=1 Tax=Promicromonospora sp. NPDC052451 TaxID=3364407 RepID=UPI0037C575AC
MGGRGEAERRADIVRYWRAIEYLSPPTVPRPEKDRNVSGVHRGSPLPWEADADHVRLPDRTERRHTVYAGIFEVARANEILREKFAPDEDDPAYDRLRAGSSALLTFTVDGDGRLLGNSIGLSQYAWAVGRTLTVGPDAAEWLSGEAFDDARQELTEALIGVGDALYEIQTPTPGTSTGSAPDAFAGTTARITLDSVVGLLQAAPVIGASAVELMAGPGAAAVVGSVGGVIAGRFSDSIRSRFGTTGEDDDGGQAESDDTSSTDDEELRARIGTEKLTVDHLGAITRLVAEYLGVARALRPTEVWVRSYSISTGSSSATDGFLRSFQADDLGRVATALSVDDAGAALTSYLSSDVPVADRLDVTRHPHEVRQSVAPACLPAGRWPTSPAQPLVLGQQFAVNRILRDLGDPQARGIYGVNGPPGTGKTTLLRDLVAGVVVERAKRLAALPSPHKAFQPVSAKLTWTSPSGRGRRTLLPLVPELTGFELVLASSNNQAVENVTLELPHDDQIDRITFPEARYLHGAARMLGDAAWWGAIAARLGRKRHRQDFATRFFWGERATDGTGLQGTEAGTETTPDQVDGPFDTPRSLTRALNDPRLDPRSPDLPSWSDAVRDFNDAVAEVDRLVHERQAVADIVDRGPDGVRTRETLLDEVDARRAGMREAEEAFATATAVAGLAAERCIEASERRRSADLSVTRHDELRPGWPARLFRTRAARAWVHRTRELLERQTAAQDDETRSIDTRDSTAERARDSETARVRAAEQLDEARRTAAVVAGAVEQWAESVPGAEWNSNTPRAVAARELSAPWQDAALATARSRAFLSALRLHETLIALTAGRMDGNLKAVMDVVQGKTKGVPDEAVLAAWQMLFLVVPMVSTTFASVQSMFAGLGRESLGWLIVDEAGQAAQHQAVGALWRAKRAVVVGDPRQLEPVVTLSRSVQHHLLKHFRVDPRWIPQDGSVQSAADRTSRFGTALPAMDDGGEEWVGSPLRVHRRCDRFMFNLSNVIAYDGSMVFGVAEREEFKLLRRDAWLHVPATDARWNENDGIAVRRLLAAMGARALGRPVPDPALPADDDARDLEELVAAAADHVFVISPFSAVATGLREQFPERRFPGLKDRIGTVHTTQGKEADVTVLVLGTARSDGGARWWAARRPNLLNVAVSRARRRFIVVGDRERWLDHRYFGGLARQAGPDNRFDLVDTTAGQWHV